MSILQELGNRCEAGGFVCWAPAEVVTADPVDLSVGVSRHVQWPWRKRWLQPSPDQRPSFDTGIAER